MDRTPIKIPGKNTRDFTKAGIATRKALVSSLLSNHTRLRVDLAIKNLPRGRPLKLTTSAKTQPPFPPSAEQIPRPKKRSLQNIKSRRKMSKIEKLPTELLVEIFLYSMNIELPRSSPVIGGKLTSELVYTRTIIATFGPTWDAGYGHHILRRPNFHGDEYPLSGFPPESIPKEHGEGDGGLQVKICTQSS